MPFKFNPFTDKLDEVSTGSSAGGVYTINSTDPDGVGNFNLVGSTNISVTPGVASDTLAITGQITVAHGGTGDSSVTAYAPVCGGTTTTAAMQSAGTGISNSGYVLTSNGASALPSWQASTGGTNTIDGDTGSATGATITFTGNAVNTGNSVNFSASGSTVSLNIEDSNNCIFLGTGAGGTSGTSGDNVGIGDGVFANVISANSNCALGVGALNSLTTGSGNVGIGKFALQSLTTGQEVVAIGIGAGTNYDFGSESSNICLAAFGTPNTSGEIQIGRLYVHTSCFIQGIDGVTVTGSPVLCSATGQLGDVVSSREFKENIKDIDDESQSLMELRPVRFNFKSDPNKSTSYGMIAEEVADTFPELVIYKDHKPYSVKYHEMPALLLNEMQKMAKRIEELEKQLKAN